MCGIAGLIYKKPISKEKLSDMANRMSCALEHRGPDEKVIYATQDVTLVMQRLAIIDLTKNLYPFISDSKNLVLTFNGEIYNFQELKASLIEQGVAFHTESDAEVILKGYEREGKAYFSKLRGMFAIAIWDAHARTLVLVRDRLGIKPLYYYNSGEAFAFASEVKALTALAGDIVDVELNEENLRIILGFMFLPKNNETIYKHIFKLEPGTIAEIKQEGVTFEPYWNLVCDNTQPSVDFDTAVQRLEELLIESIKLHLISDAPLGLLLSGGVDSGLIAAIIQKHNLASELRTFTAKFDHRFDESSLAKETANQLRTNHTEIHIDQNEINRNFENYIESFDDIGTFDGGLITTKILCSKIKECGIKVLLLGEGADELFGGYSWFGLSKLPFSLMPESVRNKLYYYAVSRNLTFNFFHYSGFWHDQLSTLVPSGECSIFDRLSLAETRLQLPNHLLMKVDKGSMSGSIEARVPYLDHKVVEQVFSIPEEYKLKGSWYASGSTNEKNILRTVAEKYLPRNIAFRKKRGFLLPMKEVLEANDDKVKSYISSPNGITTRFLAKKEVEALFSGNQSGLMGMQKEYLKWRLFILEVWYKKVYLKLKHT